MAPLSDDDVPTFSGTPPELQEAKRALAKKPSKPADEEYEDQTSAEVGVPAGALPPPIEEGEEENTEAGVADHEEAGHEADDQTVQQRVSAPSLKRPVMPPPTVASPVMSAPVPSTDPVPVVDGDVIEDSVEGTNPTAPRISSSKIDMPAPTSVQIRTLEHDDETEVKTMANLSPALQKVLRTMQSTPSQPPPPQRGPPTLASKIEPPPPDSTSDTSEASAADPSATSPAPHAAALAASVVLATDLPDEDVAPDSTEDPLPADLDEESVTAQSLAPRTGSMSDAALAAPPTPVDTPKEISVVSAPPESSPEPSTNRAADRAAVKAVLEKESAAADEPATRPGLGGEVDDPPTRPGLVEEPNEPPTRPGLETATNDPPTRPGLPDPPTSPKTSSVGAGVAARPPAETEVDDSVTTLAPKVAPDFIAGAAASAALDDSDDSSEGLTTRVKRASVDRPVPAKTPLNATLQSPKLPADDEAESITAQAPPLGTNVLRVIASVAPTRGSQPDVPIDDDDEPPENRTAVMANAPLKLAMDPVPRTLGPRAAVAPQLHPTSESGLRARPGSGSGERASLGALGIADHRSGHSVVPENQPSLVPLAHAPTEQALFPPSTAEPSLYDLDLGKGPRYGLLVAVVAIISFVVPVSLYLVLRSDGEAATPGVANEPAADFQKHDGPRAKAEKGKKPPPPEPSTSPSSRPNPFRRR